MEDGSGEDDLGEANLDCGWLLVGPHGSKRKVAAGDLRVPVRYDRMPVKWSDNLI